MNNDDVILVLRHFKWNQRKLDEEWFDNQETIRKVAGITYDTDLIKAHPQINDSRADKNNNSCGICTCDFEDNDEQYKPDQLPCGH